MYTNTNNASNYNIFNKRDTLCPNNTYRVLLLQLRENRKKIETIWRISF